MAGLSTWFRSSSVRRTFAVSAVVLATGGLLLYRAPASSANPTVFSAPLTADGKNSVAFSGPGLHGVLSLSHTQILAGQSMPVYAELRIAADPIERATKRAPIAMAIVLDTSGSMEGAKIEDAKKSVLKLLGDMRDDDQVSFVRYSDSAELIQPLARVGSVRSSLSSKIRDLTANGGTNIPSGLERGLRTLQEGEAMHVKRVVLVSDGLDSTRVQAESIARSSFLGGVNVSSLGIGLDFDEAYMGAVAQNGHGNFAFVKEGSSIATFLKQELEETSLTTIENAHVKLDLPSDLHFVSATGAEASSQSGTVDLQLGSLFSGDERRVIVELRASGSSTAVAARASWNRVGSSETTIDIKPLSLVASNDASAVESGKDGAVFASVTSVISSQRQLEATNAYARGDVSTANKLAEQNTAALGAALAAAPTAAAPAIQAQIAAYEDQKKTFKTIAPSSDRGRAAAKSGAVQDLDNLNRSSKKF